MNPDVWITALTVLAMIGLCLYRLHVERQEDRRRDREFRADLEVYRRGRDESSRDRDVQPPLR